MSNSLRWRWLQAIAASDLPSTSRLVCHTLALHMDSLGANCYPGIGTICSESGLGRTAVCRHLDSLEGSGWIGRERDPRPSGAWGRTTYRPVIPAKHVVREENDGSADVVREENDPASEGEGVVPLAGGVVPLANEGRSSETPPRRSPRERETEETDRETDGETGEPRSASAEPNWVAQAVEVWKEHTGGTFAEGRMGSALKPAVEEHGAETVLAALAHYLARHVEDERLDYATPEGLARVFGVELDRMKGCDEGDLRGWET